MVVEVFISPHPLHASVLSRGYIDRSNDFHSNFNRDHLLPEGMPGRHLAQPFAAFPIRSEKVDGVAKIKVSGDVLYRVLKSYLLVDIHARGYLHRIISIP